MKDRVASLCILLVCILISFNGCVEKNQVVNNEDPQDEVTTITFFGNKYGPENVTVIERIISGFMEVNFLGAHDGICLWPLLQYGFTQRAQPEHSG